MAMTTVHLFLTFMLRALNLIAILCFVSGLLLASNDAVVVGGLAELPLLFLKGCTSVFMINIFCRAGPRVAQSVLQFARSIECFLLVDLFDLLTSLLFESTHDRVLRLHHIFNWAHGITVLQSIQQLVKTVLKYRSDAADDSSALPLILDRWYHACDEIDLLLHLLQLTVVHRQLGGHLRLLQDTLTLLLGELLRLVRYLVTLHNAILVNNVIFLANLLMFRVVLTTLNFVTRLLLIIRRLLEGIRIRHALAEDHWRVLNDFQRITVL